MQAELVGAASQRVQLQKRRFSGAFQYAVLCQRLLAPFVHDTDETAAADLIDR